jgi:hypothetical protein
LGIKWYRDVDEDIVALDAAAISPSPTSPSESGIEACEHSSVIA